MQNVDQMDDDNIKLLWASHTQSKNADAGDSLVAMCCKVTRPLLPLLPVSTIMDSMTSSRIFLF